MKIAENIQNLMFVNIIQGLKLAGNIQGLKFIGIIQDPKLAFELELPLKSYRYRLIYFGNIYKDFLNCTENMRGYE